MTKNCLAFAIIKQTKQKMNLTIKSAIDGHEQWTMSMDAISDGSHTMSSIDMAYTSVLNWRVVSHAHDTNLKNV